MLAWQYDYANPAVHAKPDYDFTTLPWQAAHPQQFDIKSNPATLVTNAEPFAYQVFAIVNRNGARAASFHFDVTVESGGVTIGLLQDGKWIASSSTQSPGRFTDSNSTLLGSARSITLVIANNNASGESRLTVADIRLYLRK